MVVFIGDTSQQRGRQVSLQKKAHTSLKQRRGRVPHWRTPRRLQLHLISISDTFSYFLLSAQTPKDEFLWLISGPGLVLCGSPSLHLIRSSYFLCRSLLSAPCDVRPMKVFQIKPIRIRFAHNTCFKQPNSTKQENFNFNIQTCAGVDRADNTVKVWCSNESQSKQV